MPSNGRTSCVRKPKEKEQEHFKHKHTVFGGFTVFMTDKEELLLVSHPSENSSELYTGGKSPKEWGRGSSLNQVSAFELQIC